MTAISGTNVIAPVVPFDTADQYPSHDAIYGKGGLTHAADTTARDAISTLRRREGMLCYVQADGLTYQLQADLTTWVIWGSSGNSQVPLGVGVGQIIDVVAVTTPLTATWDVTLINGSNVQYSRVTASTDGTLYQHNQSAIQEFGTGFPDVYVDLSGGLLRLLADTGGAGWTAVIRRYTAS